MSLCLRPCFALPCTIVSLTDISQCFSPLFLFFSKGTELQIVRHANGAAVMSGFSSVSLSPHFLFSIRQSCCSHRFRVRLSRLFRRRIRSSSSWPLKIPYVTVTTIPLPPLQVSVFVLIPQWTSFKQPVSLMHNLGNEPIQFIRNCSLSPQFPFRTQHWHRSRRNHRPFCFLFSSTRAFERLADCILPSSAKSLICIYCMSMCTIRLQFVYRR